MQGQAWAALLKHIPEDQLNKLMLVTVAGMEIAVQNFLRIDHEMVAIKGRLAGSQDAGRVFFVPYANISHLGILTAVTDVDFHEIYDSLELPRPSLLSRTGEPEIHVLPPDPEPKPESSPIPEANGTGEKQETVVDSVAADSQQGKRPLTHTTIRSEVLDRFRARANGVNGTDREGT